jgi:hypothetical protein
VACSGRELACQRFAVDGYSALLDDEVNTSLDIRVLGVPPVGLIVMGIDSIDDVVDVAENISTMMEVPM